MRKFNVSLNINYESERSEIPQTSAHQPSHQPQIHPSYQPTVVEKPTLQQQASQPTEIQQDQYHKGAIIASGLVCILVGVQLYPPAWQWIEKQSPVKETQKIFNSILNSSFFPKKKLDFGLNLSKLDTRTPKEGDVIAQYRVTSPWGWRGDIGIPGASKYHRGVDLNTRTGTPLYSIGAPGEKVVVSCRWDTKGGGLYASFSSNLLKKKFEYLHLSKCKAGTYPRGVVIAYSGSSGLGAEHLHFQQKDPVSKKKEPPYRDYIEASITGKPLEQIIKNN